MKTLYLECQMGAAGDMLTAALLELFDNPQEVVDTFNKWGIPGVEYHLECTESHGIRGTRMHVHVNGVEEHSHDVLDCAHAHAHHEHEHHEHEHHEHEHHEHEHHEHEHHEHEHHEHAHCHTSLADIHAIVDKISVEPDVRADIMSVYKLLAEAESAAHGVTVEEVHFHEVGSMDAVADIAAVCYLLHQLHPDEIVSSPIHVGSGHVHCAHGILPVPAPATAWLLRGIPCYGGDVRGELCTPTGAALIRHFATSYGPMPEMRIAKIGYGLGQKSFECLNCVRAFIGQCDEPSEKIVEFSCNIDDMTPESLAFAQARLFEAGALEVYTTSVTMKKSRSGFVLTVHAPLSLKAQMLETIFKHTTTIGIRETICHRYRLERQMETRTTRYGDVRLKISRGYGVERRKFEYEDMARIARGQNISLEDVKTILEGD